ncbi:MAG: aminopeptidase P family protein [Tannerella sp.]|jgi:Xaa-Pro aminopeptidase|nr:aminopeptidase P family protein [Tannerella sp.]
MENQTNKRLALLRNFMRGKNLQAFVIPSTDAHMSEYIPAYWESRRWISGFTGSAGTVVVTLDKAGLWTDSRYFLQAGDELSGSEIVLFKDRLPETIRITDWLKSELGDGDRIGIDGNVFSAKEALKLNAEFEPENIKLVADYDPFNEIWHDRPLLPENKVSLHPVELTGETARQKMERILDEAGKAESDSVWISTLDTIAWLFNIRGSDVPYNPVVVSHAFISRSENVLFVDTDKVSLTVAESLKKEGIKIIDYHQTGDFLSKICNLSVCLDSSKVSFRLYNAISARNWTVDKLSVGDRLKSVKNKVEAEGFRRSMIRDGIALTRFFMWLEKAVPEGRVTEYGIGLKLKELRSEQPCFAGESFPTIAGYSANGAINHYHPSAENSLTVRPEGLLLIDSGGQYHDGTTDVTRTIAAGDITDDMKKDYTLVLKGMIGLSTAVFPAGTRGSQIDTLARKAMWQHGINYLHGTGHGVGHYLNVHEGPQSIRQEENPATILPGMIVTNEPGIYRDHQYGIRTENMMLTTLAVTTGYGDFYKFETLTLCYIDTVPVIREMMTDEEITWLNEYHQMVYDKLSPCLSDGEKDWLKKKTAALQ